MVGHYIHAAVLGPTFIKGRGADAQLTTNVWNTDASLNAFDRIQNLAITELRSSFYSILEQYSEL
jgi:hypothetical protein